MIAFCLWIAVIVFGLVVVSFMMYYTIKEQDEPDY